MDDILTYDEKIIMQLRALYKKQGYLQYKTSRFEEYSLYAEHKAFLPSGDIITFTGVNGRLMALRPDVTLSIVRSIKENPEKLTKLYYNENVYRSDGNEFKEQMQAGIECIGNIDIQVVGEVLFLAKQSLDTLSGTDSTHSTHSTHSTDKLRSHLDISHMGFINGIIKTSCLQEGSRDKKCPEAVSSYQKAQLFKCMREKNISELNKLCIEYNLHNDFRKCITELTEIYGPIESAIEKLDKLNINSETDSALSELKAIRTAVCNLGISQDIYLDFTIVNDIGYYDGIIFQGFIEGIPEKIISGGRYDMLMQKFNINSSAIGFAVYLDFLSDNENPEMSESSGVLNIALPKGRLGETAYNALKAAGYGCPDDYSDSRRLVFESTNKSVRYFWVKPSDVAIYVERGVADIGIVGKDILLEQAPDVYELLDLKEGKCRICLAGKKGTSVNNIDRTLRVATILPNVAREYFEKQGQDIDIIKLHGSIELAPLLELSDVIVDIVETGNTLKDNGLVILETIADITARLVANKVSYKFNYDVIKKLCSDLSS